MPLQDFIRQCSIIRIRFPSSVVPHENDSAVVVRTPMAVSDTILLLMLSQGDSKVLAINARICCMHATSAMIPGSVNTRQIAARSLSRSKPYTGNWFRPQEVRIRAAISEHEPAKIAANSNYSKIFTEGTPRSFEAQRSACPRLLRCRG